MVLDTFISADNVQDLSHRASADHYDSFEPFTFSGSVPVDEAGSSVPMSVFRDTGA